jgi:hypothetical protein
MRKIAVVGLIAMLAGTAKAQTTASILQTDKGNTELRLQVSETAKHATLYGEINSFDTHSTRLVLQTHTGTPVNMAGVVTNAGHRAFGLSISYAGAGLIAGRDNDDRDFVLAHWNRGIVGGWRTQGFIQKTVVHFGRIDLTHPIAKNTSAGIEYRAHEAADNQWSAKLKYQF